MTSRPRAKALTNSEDLSLRSIVNLSIRRAAVCRQSIQYYAGPGQIGHFPRGIRVREDPGISGQQRHALPEGARQFSCTPRKLVWVEFCPESLAMAWMIAEGSRQSSMNLSVRGAMAGRESFQREPVAEQIVHFPFEFLGEQNP